MLFTALWRHFNRTLQAQVIDSVTVPPPVTCLRSQSCWGPCQRASPPTPWTGWHTPGVWKPCWGAGRSVPGRWPRSAWPLGRGDGWGWWCSLHPLGEDKEVILFYVGGSARRQQILQIVSAKKRTKGGKLLIKARNESKHWSGEAGTSTLGFSQLEGPRASLAGKKECWYCRWIMDVTSASVSQPD